MTGIAQLMVPVLAKRLDLLRQLVPRAHTIALLINPTNPFGDAERREMQVAMQTLGLRLYVVHATNKDQIDDAFATMMAEGVSALLIGADVFSFAWLVKI